MKKMLGMLAMLILGASLSLAQTADPNADRGTGAPTTQNSDNNRGGHDWGWLGLLGLAGLAGLRGRKQYMTDRERDVTNIRRAA